MPTVRYFAAARAATGVHSEDVDAATVGELRRVLAQRHGDRLTRILPACGVLVSGLSARGDDDPIGADDTVDVLPPFAGG